jgi:hypothetical protein
MLSADGRTLVCTFAAPDAESARNALRKMDADIRRLWTASVYEGTGRHRPQCARRALVSGAGARSSASRRSSMPRHGVSSSIGSSGLARSCRGDGRRMLCQYRAPDVESVRLAQREAGLPVDALWAFERIGPRRRSGSP